MKLCFGLETADLFSDSADQGLQHHHNTKLIMLHSPGPTMNLAIGFRTCSANHDSLVYTLQQPSVLTAHAGEC